MLNASVTQLEMIVKQFASMQLIILSVVTSYCLSLVENQW